MTASSYRLSLRFGFAFLALTSLAACAGLKEDLGLGRNPPDEFAVVDRPPLSMPPDFSLRPPQPGAARPQDVDPAKKAKAALFDEEPAARSQASSAEAALLEQAQADKADPTIRDVVDRESSQKVVGSEHLVDKIMSWTGSGEKPATTVNAAEEAERIKVAKDKGEPVNSTPTPIIERGKSGWLGL